MFLKKIWMVFKSSLGPASKRATLMHKGLNTGSTWIAEGEAR